MDRRAVRLLCRGGARARGRGHLRRHVVVVAQRTHEIGLRMALGAGRGRLLLQVLREGMKTAAIGTLVGSVGAYYVVSAMRSLVYAWTPSRRRRSWPSPSRF